MNDPKLANAPIVRRTNCSLGSHMFQWADVSSSRTEPWDIMLRCDCQAYTWAEWQKLMEEKLGNAVVSPSLAPTTTVATPFQTSDTWLKPGNQDDEVAVIAVYDTQTKKTSFPHRQRIGEKASISDVWSEGTTEVHTQLMYSRQDACEWCQKGIPFATEDRTEHYIVTSPDATGKQPPYSYHPCTAVKEST